MSEIILYSIIMALVVYSIYLIYVIKDKGQRTKEEDIILFDSNLYYKDECFYENLGKILNIIIKNENQINSFFNNEIKENALEKTLDKIKEEMIFKNIEIDLKEEDILFIIKLYDIFRNM